MSIGTVQESNCITGYAGYAPTGDAKTDAFYSGLSSAVEKADKKGTGELLGMTMLPYSDMMSYGITADGTSIFGESADLFTIFGLREIGSGFREMEATRADNYR